MIKRNYKLDNTFSVTLSLTDNDTKKKHSIVFDLDKPMLNDQSKEWVTATVRKKFEDIALRVVDEICK